MRSVHLVGSYPAASVDDAMESTVAAAAPRLRTLADGEVGERRNWVVHVIESLRSRPDVELVKDGDWSSYDNRPVFKMKRGRTLTAESLDLDSTLAASSYATFQQIREKHGLDGVSFQVGIPGDLDLALFSFGLRRAFGVRGAYREALSQKIKDIGERGSDVVFQLEIPVELVMVASTPRPFRELVARVMASGVAKLIAASPPGTRFGLHLCVGDLNQKALRRLDSTAPLVSLCQAIMAAWPEGRGLEYVHVPLAAGDHPPVTDEDFYQQLIRLRQLPADVRFIAGLAHENQDFADQQRILNIVEDALDRQVDVSAACGLGRRTPEHADRVVQRAVDMADSGNAISWRVTQERVGGPSAGVVG